MLNNTYLLWMAGSALIACGVHFLTAASMKKRGLLAALTMLFGTVLGVVFARLGYCLLQLEYVRGYGFADTLITDDMSMMSFFCGALGVILGAALAGICTGNPVMKALNAYAPAGALLASLARFGEYFLGLICAGNYIENEAFFFFPAAVGNEWGEWYIAVHVYAGLLYLIVFIVSLLKFREKRFLRTVFYLCLAQVLCESLRNQSLIWSQFIRVEQLICMLTAEGILIWLGIRAKQEKKRFLPAIIGVLCAGVFVAVEFAAGGKLFNGVHPIFFYLVMAAGLAVLGVMESWLIRRQMA